MRIAVTAVTNTSASDVLLDVDDDASVEAVAAVVCQAVGTPCEPISFAPKPGVALPGDGSSAAAAGLRHGLRVGLGQGSPDQPVQVEGLQLAVVGGPHSGLVFALPLGQHEIGRGGVISWPDDMLLSRRHVRLTVSEDVIEVVDLESSNGTYLDGRRLEPGQPAKFEPGAVLGVGTALLEVRRSQVADAAVELGEPGWVNFLRPPRIPAHHPTPSVEVPKAPDEPTSRRFPLLAMIAPLIMGAVMVLVMKNMMYALFMLLSPLMLIFNFISDKQTGRATYKKNLADYHENLARAQESLETAIGQEKLRLRSEWPDAADTLWTCLLPGRRLWERRPGDPDALAIRLGTSDIPSTVKVTGGDSGADHRLIDVPVGVVLTRQPVVGLAGPPEIIDPLLRWVVIQLAAYHPTRDLTCSFVGLGADDWGWLQWLPHWRPDSHDEGPIAYVATEEKAVADHLTGLAAMVQARQDAARKAQGVVRFPTHVLVVRDYRSVRLMAGLGAVLDDGPSVGVYVVCTDLAERTLPEEAAATLVVESVESCRASLRRRGDPPVERVLVDGVSGQWCDKVARELSPLVDIGADDQDGALPTASRLLEVLGLDPPEAQAVLSGWLRGGRTTRAVIGEAVDGPFSVDIRSDGPHGLVAGTTGSGKSELLQTLVASLAVGNRPDEMNFVLIDYKGGAAFKDCANLPHTVGMVSDLDGHLTNRALESLGAELRRREHQLARAGAKDIEDYLELKTAEDEPMPRLLIIIDEFAALVQELPDFVAGLIDITRRGRSLGTHLILATQRPAGVVSAEIKSNTNLRIALRVTDAGDSTDVIDAPDAAHILKSLPGRAYARLGHSSLIGFQSSRVGGHPPGSAEQAPAWAWSYSVADLPCPPPTPEDQDSASAVPTDLSVLVEMVRQASSLAGVAAPPPPWLPPLDTVVTLDQLIAEFPSCRPSVDQLALPIGMTDIPSQQRRDVSVYDIAYGSNLVVAGMGRTGRSSFLRLVAAGVGVHLSPADVHLYAVDCGNNALLSLVNLPHVGAVVARDQADRIDRLATLIQRLISERQQRFAMEGFADLAEFRANNEPSSRLPYIVVLFDDWDIFARMYESHDSGHLISAWQQIIQEGASVGVRVIATGDRTLLSGRTAVLFPDKLLLRLPDPGEYSVIGMSGKSVPESMPPGRAFRAQGKLETQVALLDPDPSGAAQTAAIHRICQTAKHNWADLPVERRPRRVDVLPPQFAFSQLGELETPELPRTAIPVAVGGDTLGLRCLDVDEHGPALLVAGPRRSGRSTTLLTIANFVHAKGWSIAMFTPRVSPLRGFTASERVYGPFDTSVTKEHAVALLEDLRSQPVPSLVLVDDIELFGADGWFSDVLSTHLDRIRDSGSLFVGAGTPALLGVHFSGPVSTLKKSRSGVLLSPQSTTDSDLFGAVVPRSSFSQAMPPGGGFLVQVGAVERVQVLWPDGPLPQYRDTVK